MRLPPPISIHAGSDDGGFDGGIDNAPNTPAVFLIHPHEGAPYLGRTAVLKRRLRRLLKKREGASRFLNLREVAARVDYWLTGSRLEQSLFSWALGRQHFPEDYRKRIKLRLPPWVKLILNHTFPRTQVTTRLSGNASFYGPFRTRAAAERFEGEFLDREEVLLAVPAEADDGVEASAVGLEGVHRAAQLVGELQVVEEDVTEVGKVGDVAIPQGRKRSRIGADFRKGGGGGVGRAHVMRDACGGRCRYGDRPTCRGRR